MIIFWTLAIAAVTALACALCGVFLVVKREALVAEGLSHAVLPGIVVAFVLLRDRSSPLLIAGAALMGLLMVLAVQALKRTRLVEGDASLGIVFAAMFSGGIILSKLELRNTHFHAHCIIDGNLALAPLNTISLGWFGDVPQAFVVMLAVLVMLIAFIAIFYKEFKIMLFDETLARGFGFRPAFMHVAWLGLVSITTVAAFETAGSILVVALMITPPAAAWLLTKRLDLLIVLSCIMGLLSAVGGFGLGMLLDVSPTGPMSAVAGALFLAALCFAPGRGLLARWFRRRSQRQTLYRHLILLRLTQGQQPVTSIADTFRWPRGVFESVLQSVHRLKWVEQTEECLQITKAGLAELENAAGNNQRSMVPNANGGD